LDHRPKEFAMAQQPSPPPGAARLVLRRFADRAQLQTAVEERLQQVLTGSGIDRPAVMLSGGSTPIPAYLELATRGLIPAPGLTLLFSDDRYVPSDSDGSNYHQSRPLFDALMLPPTQVLRIRTELPLAEATADSERQLNALLSGGRRITLGLLGLGPDGHTCSLFSAADIARGRGKLAISVHRPDGRDAVSVTPTVLERVEQLIFVIAGADKRTALAGLLRHQDDLTAWNAVRGCKTVEVWADAAALDHEG
jgi:6-phosphogluconolactonase